MNEEHCAQFRRRLQDLLADLDRQDAAGSVGQETVQLDQQSVGRLSRMDAMQQQAMAKATAARRDQTRRKIAAAQARIDEGEFGYCTHCGEEIAPARLDLDPTVPTCLSCARG